MILLKKILRSFFNFLKNSICEVIPAKRFFEFLIFPSSFYKYLKIISVETCSVCNLQCRYCHLNGKNRKKFLDVEIYEKLIKEISENKRYKIEVLEIPLGGEFFVHPEAKKIVEITKKYLDENPDFKPWIILNENMMLISKERVELILNSGVFNHIICSIDGHDKQSFEYMRPGANYETVIANTEYLIDRNNDLGHQVLIEINNGFDDTCKDIPLSNEMPSVFEKADSLRYWMPVDLNSSFASSIPKFYPEKGFCSFVFNSVSISSGGKAIKCCMDLKEDTKFGDFKINSLSEIMMSQKRKQFLRKMFLGKRKELKGCSSCSIKYPDINNKRDIIC